MPSYDDRGGFQGRPPGMNNMYGGPPHAPPRNANGGLDYGGPYGAPLSEACGGPYYDSPGQGVYTSEGSQRGRNNIQLMLDNGRSEPYIDVALKGRSLPSLLDSGCKQSVCALRLCRNVKVTPVKTE